jgi:hypothetical protein
MKEVLYQKLLTLKDEQTELKKSNTLASGQGIYDCLVQIFGDNVHIIHPDLSSIDSPIDSNDIYGAINYIEAIEQFIRQDEGNLQKPVIAIWNTDNVKQSKDKVDFKAEGGSHWQTLVILPKHHKIHNGHVLDNEKELVFFKDSYYLEKSLPNILKFLFKKKVIHARNLKEGEIADNPNIEVGGMLDSAEIYDETYKNVKQQEEGYDCGWWAVYNAFMFIMEGNDAFLGQFNSPSRSLGYRLRKIFSESDIDLSVDNGDITVKIKDKDWVDGFELAFRNIIIEQLKQKDQEGFKVFGSNIERLDLNYLMMLCLFVEQASLSDAYKTVEAVMKEDSYVLQQSTSRNSAQENAQHEGSFSKKTDLRYDISRETTPDGLKKSLHGNMYQLGLLTLVASRAEREGKLFYLITEAAEFEKFDDLVIDYGESITFLQAKHSAKSARYSADDFCSSTDGDASLAKYFDSWYIVRTEIPLNAI